MFKRLIVALGALAAYTYGFPLEALPGGPPGPCTTLSERKEWRTLTDIQKADYIGAVKCLQSRPAITKYAGVKTRFDDFQAVHIALKDEIHLVGQFLPWHRLFVKNYEDALHRECGFVGASPYWDWSIDVASGTIVNSPVFDPVTGFGGNGVDIPGFTGIFGNSSRAPGWDQSLVTGGGCVTDGPFASYNLSLGPGTLVTNHCLTRAFNGAFYSKLTTASVANATSQPTFEAFRIELEGFPITPTLKFHDGGHVSVGGEMSNQYSSPGDPLFYLHHANLDRIWWQWQQIDPSNRLNAISGRSSVDPPFVDVTLDFGLKMDILAPTLPIRDVMDIGDDKLCYSYI